MKLINTLIFSSVILLPMISVFASNNTVSAVENFDSLQYLGTWYEVARLPFVFEKNCVPPITAHYDINPKNSHEILVTNTCANITGGLDVAHGIAHFTDSPTIGKLKVTFFPRGLRWLPFGYGTYWVLATDYTHYALVGNPNHRYLWILYRSQKINKHDLDQLISLAKAEEFNINQLIINNSSKE